MASGAASRTLRARAGGIAIIESLGIDVIPVGATPRIRAALPGARRGGGADIKSAPNTIDTEILRQFSDRDDPL
jgi:hypothetical protein